MSDVTRILSAIDRGDAQAAEQLLPVLDRAAEKVDGRLSSQPLAAARIHKAPGNKDGK